jgi:hypothetical protein
MPRPADPRKVVGSIVEAKALHVTSLAECTRRYGARKTTKMLHGVVVDTTTTMNSKTNRATTTVTADYNLGGGTVKRATINVRSLKAVWSTTAAGGMNEESTPTESRVEENYNINNSNNSINQFLDEIEAELEPYSPNRPPLRRSDTIIEEATGLEPTTINFEEEIVNNQPETTTTTTDDPGLVATVHDTKWYINNDLVKTDINGPHNIREWGVRTRMGDVLRSGCNNNNQMSRLDVFFLMFPPRHLDSIVRFTTAELEDKKKKKTTKGEILKFFGVILLTTKFEFKSRASLWSTTAATKYEVAPAFGRTGMSRQRFDDLWMCIRFSNQPKVRPPEMSSERYRWKLVDDFVMEYNDYRKKSFIPSEMLCVDESISRWYGQGGEWINKGLPMYVAIDRKPENGCEIQTCACGKSGVMLRLRLVKTRKEEEAQEANNNNIEQTEEQLLHGTKVLKHLVEPWFFSDRVVCADSYFASVPAAEELLRMKLRFIGVVKTATKRFPVAYLSNLELQQRGDCKAVVSTINESKMMAFVWMDRDRRNFIATVSSITDGNPCLRERWRQIAPGEESPEKVELTVPQPLAAEMYYSCCAAVDQHNRDRQDTLQLERKLKTHSWSMRVNLSILGMIMVDCWRVYDQLTPTATNNEVQKEFYAELAAELIDNNYDTVGSATKRATRSNDVNDSDDDMPVINLITGQPRCGLSAHLTPTKRKRRDIEGNELSYSLQGRCRICQKKTTFQCSWCVDDPEINDEGWICMTKNGKFCFPIHLRRSHKKIEETK